MAWPKSQGPLCRWVRPLQFLLLGCLLSGRSAMQVQSWPGDVLKSMQLPQPVHARKAILRPGNSSDAPGQTKAVHAVKHVSLLNREPFWWLLAAIVFCVGVAVVQVEVTASPAGGAAIAAKEPSAPASPAPPEAADAQASPGAPREGGFSLNDSLHLAFCTVALNVLMLIWGVTQEFVMTNFYKDDRGDVRQVPSTLFVVFCNRIVAVAFTGILMHVRGKEPIFYWVSGLPALSNMAASWCQYESLEFISFTFQTVVKSGKLLPVVVLSSLRGKRHTTLDYAELAVISCGLVVFGLETAAADQEFDATKVGVLLILGLLIMDSLTPHFQDVLFKAHTELDVTQASFAMASCASVFTFVAIVCSGTFLQCVVFMFQSQQALLHLLVLSVSSALTQYMITYTIRHFGPVIFTLIATTRQVISVCMSAILFRHHISGLGMVSAAVVFSTVTVRALRALTVDKRPQNSEPAPEPEVGAELEDTTAPMPTRTGRLLNLFRECSQDRQLLICAVALHVLLCIYAVTQEFMAVHTWDGQIFEFPIFMITMNRTVGAIFALIVLKIQRLPALADDLHYTLLPAVPNFLATVPQYKALYFVFFPAQTLMKSLKVIPVMLCGEWMRTRSYSRLDYVEGFIITVLVGFFVWDFQLHKGNLSQDVAEGEKGLLTFGAILMVAYVVMDSLTSNLEDYVYQRCRIDPAQQMLGMELFSGAVALVILLATGEAWQGFGFLLTHPQAWMYLGILAVSAACGTYACTLTVRVFGPAVFTLLMTSRQVLSLVISVVAFNHTVDWLCCLCLVVVSLLTLTASLRRVVAQRQLQAAAGGERARGPGLGAAGERLVLGAAGGAAANAAPAR